jgi:DNA invertase Pin-like site-specific DNA recombinase
VAKLTRSEQATTSSDPFCHVSGRSHDTSTFANAIAYLRVSTDQQADSGLGIEAQRASVMSAAARLGLAVQEVYVDAGTSGALALTSRPVLMQAVAALHRGDVLLIAKRDRLARSVYEVAIIDRLIKKQGARIVSSAGEGTENDDPASVLFRGLLDLFAEYERLIGRARTKAGLAVKRARGERTGQLPFGFQMAADGDHVEKNPVEQDRIARIWALKATGRSTRQIAGDLNAAGLTTRRGTPWRYQYVAAALRVKAS